RRVVQGHRELRGRPQTATSRFLLPKYAPLNMFRGDSPLSQVARPFTKATGFAHLDSVIKLGIFRVGIKERISPLTTSSRNCFGECFRHVTILTRLALA